MESPCPGYTTLRHSEHDVSWMVVSPSHSSVVCVACLVEQMEDSSLPLIQRRVALSLLGGLLREGGEVASKLGDNLLLCRHLLDIITDHFFRDEKYVETAVEVCQLVLECVQSEDLLWYTIDRFHFELQESRDQSSTTAYLLLLGQLLVISPAYGFHLLDKHESLLLLLARLLIQTRDENCQCSIVYIFIQLFDDQLHSDMSDTIRSAVCQVIVTLLSDAETLDLRVNLLALLKKILKQATGDCVNLLMMPSSDNKSLVMGLKKMFISKQEVLQTASAQCVQGLVVSSREPSIVSQILESDLAEFLFESLHTQNSPQLNSVFQCLQTLTSYDQFFTPCHAVYGVESILRSLSMVLDMKNFGLTEKGFCLLASILDRQPSSIPLFVNVASMKHCVQLVKQGLSQSHPAVFLQSLKAAQALIRWQYIPWPSSCDVTQDIVKTATSQMSSLQSSLSRGEHARVHRQPRLEQMLTAFVDLITACCRMCCENMSKSDGDVDDEQVLMSVEDTKCLLVTAAETHLLPYIVSVFGGLDIPPALKNTLDCMKALISISREKTQHISLMLVKSGLLLHAHVIKSSISDPDLCKTVDTFLQNLYKDMLRNTPFLSTPPVWLISGIAKLRLLSLDVSHLLTTVAGDEDLAWTTLALLYFSCLYSDSCVEGSELAAVLQCFLARYRDISQLPPLVIRCLTFLTACSSGDAVERQDSVYRQGLTSLIEVLGSCPVDVWYTSHPVLVCWVFSEESLAQHLGHNLMEHWLPLIDLTTLTARENTDMGTQDSIDINLDIYTPVDTGTPGDTETHSDSETSENTDIQLLEDLAHNQSFFNVLLSMLVAPVEIASIAMTITEHIVIKILKHSSSSLLTVNDLLDTCNRLFHQLFLQDISPQDHQVCYLLRVMTKLMSDQKSDMSVGFNVKTVYHVVKYVGGLTTSEHWPSIQVCLQYLLKYTEDRSVADCLCIGPILSQNKEFMLSLQNSLTYSDDVSNRLTAWLAETANPGAKVPHQIHISHRYLLDAVTTGSDGVQSGALSLLSASLSCYSRTSGPVVFTRESLLQDTPLFTAIEIRTLYFHLQQLVCQDSQDIFSCAIECTERLFTYANTVHSSLAHHLASQPWNSLWFETLLHMSSQHGVLVPKTLSLIYKLIEFPPGQELLGTMGDTFLHTVLKSDLQTEQTHILKQILLQCKTELEKKVKPDLLEQVQTQLVQQTVH